MATIVAVVTGKIVLKYCNISKSPGKGSINLPPPPNLYHSGGMNLHKRLRVKLFFEIREDKSTQCWRINTFTPVPQETWPYTNFVYIRE